jgi:hypothetical protein
LRYVPRLGPGDLAPAMDLESKNNATLLALPNAEIIRRSQEWMDGVEKALGRTPIMYTGVVWRDQLHSRKMSDYPLWTAHAQRKPGGGWTGQVFGGWNDWLIWQYAEDGSAYWGLDPYHEAGIHEPGIDFDAFNGSIYQLRGHADLGRTAPYVTAGAHLCVYTDANGRLRVIEADETVSDLGALASPAGDPAAGAMSDQTESIVFRAGADDHIWELTRKAGAPWKATDLTDQVTSAAAFHDPTLFVDGNRRTVVYWTDDDHFYRAEWDGGWSSSDLTTATGCPSSAGQAVSYLSGGNVHSVGRVGTDGHLADFWRDAGDWQWLDMMDHATDEKNQAPPAATHRPCVWNSGDGNARIVYRALRGDLWQIERDSLGAVNLSAASTNDTPTATGSPAAFLGPDGAPHVVFRSLDGRINDLHLDGGQWKCDDTGCVARAAADPSYDGESGVTFLSTTGVVNKLVLELAGWRCVEIESSAQ